MIIVALLAAPLFLLLRFKLEWHWLVSWLVAINVVALPIWFWDKRAAAREGAFRIPEWTLHTMAFVGATPASFAAMPLFRHKTLHLRFKVLYVVFLILQVTLFIWATSEPTTK